MKYKTYATPESLRHYRHDKFKSNVRNTRPIYFNGQTTYSLGWVQTNLCNYTGMTMDVIKMSTRKSEIKENRQIGMFLTKTFVNMSLSDIGTAWGGKDHATVLHACKRVNDLIFSDKNFKLKIDKLIELIKAE